MFDLGGHDTRVLTVVSGKGGVGKSVLSVNLATTLASEGRTVALLDADVGQGSCAYLVGPDSPVHLVTPDPDLGPTEAIEALEAQLVVLRSKADIILIDAPAGIGPTVRWALDRADAGLLVLVDEPTAIADAYALAKLTWHHDPSYPLAGVVNMVDSLLEATDVMERFSALTSHFLDRKILYGGWVPFSGAVRASVRKQIPAIRESMAVARAFDELAGRVRCGLFQTLAPLAMN
jgi:flagellar biosynthesis protein FlhG